MTARRHYPWEGWAPGAVILRFLMSAFLILPIDILVGILLLRESVGWPDWFLCRLVPSALVGIPAAWGIPRIFFFQAATNVFRH